MSLVSSRLPLEKNSNSHSTEAKDTSDAARLSSLLGAFTNNTQSSRLMERGAPGYSQSGLHTSYPSAFTDAPSEESTADNSSAAHYTPQEVRSNGHANYSTSATPTSEYSAHPASARSSTFPEHITAARQYYPASNHSGSSGGMAQPTSPSMPLQDGRSNHHNNHSQIKSDGDVPIDPSIAASSPTYPPHGGGQYSPYPPNGEMSHGYPQHTPGAMYAQPRPDWSGYGQHPQHGMPGPYAVSGAQTPTSAAPAGARPGGQHPHQLSQVYSFVPIPGAQQHKRPRRRYEEIERMYKCGWNGCEKAYGTLNHLNAHVTMQSHGQKRTPEEFKEIRKEWKARKKEDDNQRKAEEERARGSGGQANPADAQGVNDSAPSAGYQQGGRGPVQLPPIGGGTIGYQPGTQVDAHYPASGGVAQLQQYSGSQQPMYTGYPSQPYGANTMYNQHNGAAPKYEGQH